MEKFIYGFDEARKEISANLGAGTKVAAALIPEAVVDVGKEFMRRRLTTLLGKVLQTRIGRLV